jgi:outer membrane biosynthesis protein TonB
MAAKPNPQQQQGGPRHRILRIGILLGGKIVEERLIRERTSVTIGQSMKNTFSIPVEGLPLELTLFSLENDKYNLRFLNKMDGRLSSGDQVNTLEQLKGKGAANHGDYWSVPLGESARGKLALGDLTILFQFVTEPPRQPKPMLPASVRGTFADRFDPRLSVILGASIIIHFAIVIIALTMDLETGEGISDRAYNLTFSQEEYKVDIEQPKPVETAQQSGADQGSAKPAEKPKTVPTIKKPDAGGDAGRDQGKDVQLKQEENAKAMADLLTGEGANGTSEGDMSKRRPGADLGAQIADVREGGKQVGVGGGTNNGPRGNGDPRVGTGKGPAINGPGGTETAGGPKEEKAPTGRISVSEKVAEDDTTLTPDAVLGKIMSAYMTRIKRCYTDYLKKDASARGKVSLSFTVNPKGRLVSPNAKGFAADVDSCVEGLMSGWTFAAPKDKDGEETEASFSITLQLVPD